MIVFFGRDDERMRIAEAEDVVRCLPELIHQIIQ